MASKEPQLPSEKEIASLTREAQVAYAARCALRVFPLIGSRGHFDFWGDDAKRHVESVFAAVLSTMIEIPSAEIVVDQLSELAQKAAVARVPNAVIRAVWAAQAAKYESGYHRTISVTKAARAAFAAARFILSEEPAIAVERSDFELLRKAPDGLETGWSIYQCPLFQGSDSFYTLTVFEKIQRTFISIDEIELLEIWMGFHDGDPLPKEELHKWLENWLYRHQSQPDESRESESNTSESEPQEQKRNEYRSPGITSNAPDAPASVDRLGRDRLINPLAAMLSLPDQKTPLTIGLFGHWGSGKSTVMRLLQRKLSENRKSKKKDKREFLFSWFNCWEYEQTENIPAGLAQEVVRGLLTDGSYQEDERNYSKEVNCFTREVIRIRYHWLENRWQTLKLIGKWLLVLVAALWSVPFITELEDLTSVLLGSGIMGTTLVFAWQLFKQGKILWEHPLTTEMATFFKLPSFRKELGQIPAIRRQLNSLCKVRLYEKKWNKFIPYRRLVVFVDDLDRCKPETIAKTFDAIRLITDIPEVIVMIGIDERVAFKAMGEAYKAYAEPQTGRRKEDVARDYLGKIIQVPIRLSRPANQDLWRYIGNLFPIEFRRIEEKEIEEVSENEETASDSDISETPTEEAKETVSSNLEESIRLDEIEERDPVSEEETVEQMKETPEEVKAFFESTGIFEFTNPRRLLRLRNSYRLLKGIFPNELRLGFAGDTTQPDWEYALMLMLFWLEFRTESSEDQIKEWIEHEKLKTDDRKNDDLNVLFRNNFYKAIKKRGIDSLFGKDEPLLRQLERFALTCVLPYPKKEAVLKDPEGESTPD